MPLQISCSYAILFPDISSHGEHTMNNDINRLIRDPDPAIDHMISEITHICRDMPSRAPGSPGERQAALYMANQLKTECGCSDVRIESFREHPSAFYGYFYFSMTFDVLSWVGLALGSPWMAIASACIALFLFIVQFVMYHRLIDPLFPEKESINITAVRPCADEVKQRVFINGHSDAAWEFPLNYHFGGIVFEIPGVMALIGVLCNIAIAICALLSQAWTSGAAAWAFIFVPFYILVAFTYDPRRVVDGANDNLSGCYMGISLLWELERRGIVLQHTEVGVIITGSEEAGLRGAKAWSVAHASDYRDVPTFILSFDTIHDPRHLTVNTRDLNGTLASDAQLAESFLRAAHSLNIPCKKGIVPLMGGSTDSAAFTQGGFRSVGVTGLNHKLEDYYHTRLDSFDNLNREGLTNCYRATVNLIASMDASR